jgi:hypothetical protein
MAMKQDVLVEQSPATRRAGSRYDLFGLTFESAEPIPGLVSAPDAPGDKVIRIEFGPVPQRIANPQFEDDAVQASAAEYLFNYPGVLRLYVERDKRIVVERLADCDPVRLWTIVLGIGASVTGFRRGYIPLHASSIVTAKGCIAFAGQTGAGKSTIAASLVKRGFELFADDLCLVQWDAAGRPIIGQGVPELRLWDDAVAALGWRGVAPFAVLPEIKKSVFRRAASRERFARLRRIYALEFSSPGVDPGIYPVHGIEALQAVISCLRLRLGLLPVGAAGNTFERLAAIGDQIEIFRFVRPLDHGHSAAWHDRLIEHFET